MTNTPSLKFACAFCNYNSDNKKSVKTHFRNCPEKYNSRIDLTNPNFFRMINAKNCIKNRKLKEKKERLDIKEKREREKSIKFFLL